MTSITVRVDEKTKTRAAEIADDFGLDLSSVTRAFYKQIVRENRIPLNLSYREPNTESRAAIAESEEILKSGQRRFKTAEEVFEALGI